MNGYIPRNSLINVGTAIKLSASLKTRKQHEMTHTKKNLINVVIVIKSSANLDTRITWTGSFR